MFHELRRSASRSLAEPAAIAARGLGRLELLPRQPRPENCAALRLGESATTPGARRFAPEAPPPRRPLARSCTGSQPAVQAWSSPQVKEESRSCFVCRRRCLGAPGARRDLATVHIFILAGTPT